MVPAEYLGREQSWLKHRVLQEYLVPWAIKLASVARSRSIKIWYVDCFAGPWQSAPDDLADPSGAIGLEALRAAQGAWKEQGAVVEVGAVFVEKSKRAFERLSQHIEAFRPEIDVRALAGEFGDHVSSIDQIIGRDAAFVLVDPTGWK